MADYKDIIKGTLNNIACIVEFEYDWNVGVVYLCRTSIRLYVSAHISDVIKAVTVAGTEFRTLYLVQFLELALWNFCAEIEMLVLGYDGKRLASLNIVAAVNQTLFDEASARCGDYYAASTACFLHACICQFCSLIFCLRHSEVFIAYYLIFYKDSRTGVVTLCTLVVDTCTLHGIAVGNLHSC